MRKMTMLGLAALALNVVFATTALGQAVDRPAGSPPDGCSEQILAELRRTRAAVEQLKRELIQLQVATVRMRLQQDVVANKEARLDSVRSEVQAQTDVLAHLQERAKKLDALDTPQQSEEERERVRAEREDAKKELEREESKLESLHTQEAQLTAELQTERARLNEFLLGIESLTSEPTRGASNKPVSDRDLPGQPNN